MDQYSLEAFERYPVVRCRPEELREPAEGTGVNRFRTVEADLRQRPEFSGPTLLALHISREETSRPEETESALRAYGAGLCCHPCLLGVTLRADGPQAIRRRLWEAAAEAFSPIRLIIPVTDAEQLDYTLKRDIAGGLLAPIGANPYDTCEAFAEQGIQRLYRRMPVLVRAETDAPENAADYAEQWHASAAENVPDAVTGCRIALRRLTYPKRLSSGGFAPMRFWWTNRGPAYRHGKAQAALRLAGDNGCVLPIPVPDAPEHIPLADRVFNGILRLPAADPGEYRLEFGLFDETGTGIALCHPGRTADGWYPAGMMRIDLVPRPEYEHVWDGWDPDAYYPLFDPKVPGTK